MGSSNSYAFDSEQLFSTPQLSLYRSELIPSKPKKINSKINDIAQKFIPIVITANGQDYLHFLTYYLPVYNNIYQKDFFLII
jgi:hypothetical protein